MLLKGGFLVTMNPQREVYEGDLRIEHTKIKAIGRSLTALPNEQVIDVRGQFVLPGMIQGHTHLCQVLFRGLADDLVLLDWLQTRIWPFESNHDEKSLAASARVGLLEMQLLGTTSILDMGTVRFTDSIFEEVKKSKMRYYGGKCLMDLKEMSGPLYEPTSVSLKDQEGLIKRWHKSTDLIEYAICPRFAISCTDEMLSESVRIQKNLNVLIHTHASESEEEVELVEKRTGKRNIEFLHDLKMLNKDTVIAHGIHLSRNELKQMIDTQTGLTHCPSSNLKLASGVAHIEHYWNSGMRKIALGSDGAPCNNTMDPFLEMRLAALLQKPLVGPTALPAERALELATLGGARVLGREKDLGSLEIGKLADVITVRRDHPSIATVENPYSALVYSASGRDVANVFIHGECIVRDGIHQFMDTTNVMLDAKSELKKLLNRSGLIR